MAEDSNIKVCVRVRPFNRREQSQKTCIIRMYRNATIITPPQKPTQQQVFTFDHSFWSIDQPVNGSEDINPTANSNPCVTQQEVYETVGTQVLKNVMDGYNGCIMAYGQSGSGKTHTMMGSLAVDTDRGLIPRLCSDLFERMKLAPHLKVQVELSYLEIYAEQIRDLIHPENTHNLRVREHPETGPYVEGLTTIAVDDFYSVHQFILYGNSHRVTATTQLNDRSSRSHAIFILYVTQVDPTTNEPIMRSKLCLVDLAGSERVKDSGVSGIHLQEAANINQSLTTLGRVINILAKSSSAPKKHALFVPFRDSMLTWLLKDTLGGNSKTVMIATISPSSLNYDETLGTLQYAYRAKQIVNKVSVNAGKNEVLMKKLKEELKLLEERWNMLHHTKFEDVKKVPMDEQAEALLASTSAWSKYVQQSQQWQSQSMATYQQHFQTVWSDLQCPFLFHCNPSTVDQHLIHYVPPGRTHGTLMHPALTCEFVHDNEGVWIVPLYDDNNGNDVIHVNSQPMVEPRLLEHGDKLSFGTPTVIFKFKIPICAIK